MNLWQDIRYGERMLRKSPGFAITAVLALALGIGATTAVFSVCDSLLWKPIAVPHLESLVMVAQRVPGAPNDWNSSSPADLDDVRRESTVLENLATWDRGMANIAGAGGEPERALQALVSANFFTSASSRYWAAASSRTKINPAANAKSCSATACGAGGSLRTRQSSARTSAWTTRTSWSPA